MLALDVPTSEVHEPEVKADTTITLGAAEAGPRRVTGARGRLWLADSGVSPELYANPTIGVRARTPFNERDLIKLSA